MVAGTLTSAVVGGSVSELTGGKFGNGAVTAAFQFALNNWMEANKLYQKNKIEMAERREIKTTRFVNKGPLKIVEETNVETGKVETKTEATILQLKYAELKVIRSENGDYALEGEAYMSSPGTYYSPEVKAALALNTSEGFSAIVSEEFRNRGTEVSSKINPHAPVVNPAIYSESLLQSIINDVYSFFVTGEPVY